MAQDNKIPQHASMLLFSNLFAIKPFFVLNHQNNRTFTHPHTLRFFGHGKQRHQLVKAMFFLRARLAMTNKDLCLGRDGNDGFVWHVSLNLEKGKERFISC